MAATDFPSSPITGQVFTNSVSAWQWDGAAWRVLRQIDAAVDLVFNAINLGTSTPLGVFTGAKIRNSTTVSAIGAEPFITYGQGIT
jgi:hypothetical protein